MSPRTGTASLPLHRGRAPAWLFQKMVRLARGVAGVILAQEGSKGLLKRLADPFWFQSFGCVLGFDWHSSGLTTTVCGALKEALSAEQRAWGVTVCGGKGRAARRTPDEIVRSVRWGLPASQVPRLQHASRMAAKVDAACVQDGYELYHHCLVFDTHGRWAVIQQGMNTATRWARRYHWWGEAVDDFVCEPHNGVSGPRASGPVLNLVARESGPARSLISDLCSQPPRKIVREYERLLSLKLPLRHHIVAPADIKPNNLHKILTATFEAPPEDFAALLGRPGVGPRTLRALSFISELIYGTPVSWRDPARFSYAHGGKDGHPYPVDRAVYEETIEILNKAVQRSDIGRDEKTFALKKLYQWQASLPRRSPFIGTDG